MKKALIGVVAMLCLWSKGQGQEIKALGVGDKVPDMAFRILNNGEIGDPEAITLSQYRGKLVILDFWGRYCSPCIKALPAIDSLQKVFKDQVKVITIADFKNTDEVAKAWQKFPALKNIRLPVAIRQPEHAAAFPHKIISHVVWIGGNGRVKAITGTERITARNIEEMLSKETVSWPVKKDITGFDASLPLLSLSGDHLEKPAFLFYSTLTGHLKGISPPNGTLRQPESPYCTTGFYNLSLLHLCQLAMNGGILLHKEDFELNVSDSSRFIKPAETLYEEWTEAHTYCYSLLLPAHYTKEQIAAFVSTDLLRWLQVLGIKVESSSKKGKKYLITTI